jgi:2-keto-4-pentenoate hydratase/2-oxohepta-3-ene-1,7-dioic acid hydratase in catechol pathway
VKLANWSSGDQAGFGIVAECGPAAHVIPSVTQAFDYEGELAAVIGRPVHRETPEQPADAVAGWSACHDGTARDHHVHTSQWTPGKSRFNV